MKQTRKYGLFEKRDGKWVQLYPELTFTLDKASRVFQDAMLASALGYVENERRLRPIKEVK